MPTSVRLLAVALLLASPLAAQAKPAAGSSGAADAARAFLTAVADSNISAMAQLWGTKAGPAAETKQPADYIRRLIVMQAFMRGGDYVITSDLVDQAQPSQRIVEARMTRGDCVKAVPFTMIQAGRTKQWIVTSVDLTAVGTPGRSCAEVADSAKDPGER